MQLQCLASRPFDRGNIRKNLVVYIILTPVSIRHRSAHVGCFRQQEINSDSASVNITNLFWNVFFFRV